MVITQRHVWKVKAIVKVNLIGQKKKKIAANQTKLMPLHVLVADFIGQNGPYVQTNQSEAKLILYGSHMIF